MKQGNNRFFRGSTSNFAIDSIKGYKEVGFSTIVGAHKCSSTSEIYAKVMAFIDPRQSAINLTRSIKPMSKSDTPELSVVFLNDN